MKKCILSGRLFTAIIFFLIFGFFNNLAYGNEEVAVMLDKGINLYESKKYDEAMDYFIDVSVNGNSAQMSQANTYINKIHLSMADSYSSDQNIYTREAEIQREADVNALEVSAIEQREMEVRGDDQINTITPAQPSAEVMTQRKAFKEVQVEQKIKDIINLALFRLNESQGIEFYMRKDMLNKVDAVEINPEILFNKRSKEFKANSSEILQNLYILLLANKDAVFTILPKNAYNGKVSIEGMRYSTKLYSYLLERGISSAKLNLNMGLDTGDMPAKFAHLDGMAIVFDYDVPPKLKYRKNGITEPVLSMGLYPETSISAEAGDVLIIDFSVLETKNPISKWDLQIIRNEGPNVHYTVRELKGDERVYHQIIWNGRKAFFGDMLELGVYNIVLQAVDTKGNAKILKRKVNLVDKEGNLKKTTVQGKVLVGEEKSSSKASIMQTDNMNYSVSRLWKKPGKIQLKKEEIIEKEKVVIEETPVATEPTTTTVETTSIDNVEGSAIETTTISEPAPTTPADTEVEIEEDALEGGEDLY
ncbi:MAG: hypothetical protein HOF38_05275 [Elusimicrobiaceae bacterium]|jgi:hypothetical protein|nr:hypothetical protein [Elusimicrobiaceae bacterium]MBT4008173.1 hypothetical protein [Elusimicrobiaceae bacterium]MBT4402527.1 hypothetical protein [Elusimicrobiaceae bacterium]MBT4439654.1 hypothetical protein [Elusimicrobiaceae bacterium]MBT5988052.1 hypothetical protein [Elusimicrobiaceae bacterium]